MNSIPQFNNSNMLKIICIIIVIIGIILLIVFLSKKNVNESFTLDEEEKNNNDNENEINNDMPKFAPEASEPIENTEIFKPIKNDVMNDINGNQLPKDCYPKDQLTPTELLPGDPNSKWAQVNPVGQGDLKDQNFLNAGYHLGVNTVGQTLRNANLQLRSEPANPQVKVSPWMQSTMEPDIGRRPMEIGGCD